MKKNAAVQNKNIAFPVNYVENSFRNTLNDLQHPNFIASVRTAVQQPFKKWEPEVDHLCPAERILTDIVYLQCPSGGGSSAAPMSAAALLCKLA